MTQDYVREVGLIAPDGLLSHDAQLDDVPVAEFIDISHLADVEQSTLEAAVARHSGGEEFSKLRDEIEEIAPDLFSSSEWMEGYGRINIKGKASSEIIRLIEEAPVKVDLVEGLLYNRSEIHRAAEGFAEKLPPKGSVEVYESTGDIVVRMAPEVAPLSDSVIGSLQQDLPRGVELSFQELPASMDEFMFEDQQLRGGAVINGNGFDDDGCLASFVLRNVQNIAVTRVGTARHCIDNSTTALFTLHTIDDNTTTTLTVQGLGSPSLMDIGLLSHGGWGRQGTFYADWNIKRGVYGRSGLPGIGDQICHFRKVNGTQCSTVHMHYYASGTNASTLRVVAAHAISEPGDSGGPWFHGSTAKGVHMGKYRYNDTVWLSAFTPAYLYQNMGYDVLFQGQ